MPQVEDRDEAENRLAALLLKVNVKTRIALMESAGYPPDASRVPEELYKKAEHDTATALHAVFTVVFLSAMDSMSTQFNYDVPSDVASEKAETWSRSTARRDSKSITETTRDRLENLFGRVKSDPDDTQAINNEITSRQELKEASDSIFGEKRIDGIAITSVTNATTAGEQAFAEQYEQDTGKGIHAFWRHDAVPSDAAIWSVATGGDDLSRGHPCGRICKPLVNTPDVMWPSIHPDMPQVWTGPAGHVSCDCWLEWREFTADEEILYGRGAE